MKLILSSIVLGIGLAMDACAISMANGMTEKRMKIFKMIFIALMFAIFQMGMPLIGYAFGHTIYENLSFVEKYKLIPIFSFVILLIIGSKTIYDTIKELRAKEEVIEEKSIGYKLILIQAIATSIDALSVGFTISEYSVSDALICGLIIAIVTFIICMPSIIIGKVFGNKLGKYAGIVGGTILIIIGIIIIFRVII